MENACHQSGEHAGSGSREHCHPDVAAAEHQHDAHGASGTHGPVYGQISDIEDPVGQVDADRHDSPDKPLCGCARKCVDKIHNLHLKFLLIAKRNSERSVLSRCPLVILICN